MGNELGRVIISAGVMTGTTVITGPWVRIQPQTGLSFQAKWTGTPNGAFAFDISNDDDPNFAGSPMGPTPLPLPASFAAGNPAGAASSYPFDFGPLTYRWIRIKYTNASSTGTLWVSVCGNGAAS